MSLPNHSNDLDRRSFLRRSLSLPALAGLPRLASCQNGPAARRRPNVLFVLADQLRACAVGCYGNPVVQTPHVDALAERGTRFTRALSSSPTCSPYRVQMLTGKYTHANGHKIQPEWRTLYTELSEAGYYVGHIGKWHMTPQRLQTESGYVPTQVRPGIAYSAMAEVTHKYKRAHYFLQNNDRPRPAGEWEPDMHAELAESFLDGRRDDEHPFFLTVSLGPPHPPYDPIERFDLFDPADVALRPNVPNDQVDRDRARIARYYGLVASVDEVLGRLVKSLEKNGLIEDTYVIFTSDHGDMLRSQGMGQKRKPWDEAVRIPFVIAGPSSDFRPGEVRDDFFASVDVMPTLLDLCGAERPADVQGRSVLTDEAPDSAYLEIVVAAGTPDNSPWRGLITADGWKIATSEARPEWLLYDLNDDPYELTNRIADPALAERKDELLARMREWARETGDGFFS